jgi:hypothetical protein
MNFCYDTMDCFKREGSLDGIKAVCEADETNLIELVRAQIIKDSKTRPVIVFGFDKDSSFKDSFKPQPDCNVFNVDTCDSLTIARNYFSLKSRGILFLSEEFRIGVDIKCSTDAQVLVFCAKGKPRPDREEIM